LSSKSNVERPSATSPFETSLKFQRRWP
jgi:hypothetical protein